jgi:uncharacterized protein
METPAQLLRRVRLASGLTQAELARRSGTRQSAISAYERGSRAPNLETLARIAAAAGFELDLAVRPRSDRAGPRIASDLRRLLAARREEVIDAVAASGGSNVRIFGSVARGDDRASSDVDLLIDLPARTGVFTIGRIARAVERLIGVEVDVVPAHALRPEIRSRVLREAEPL